jgi:hypothetical protein
MEPVKTLILQRDIVIKNGDFESDEITFKTYFELIMVFSLKRR